MNQIFMKNWMLIFLLCPFLSFAQTFDLGFTNLSLTDTSRSNRAVDVEVYYPATPGGGGLNVPVAMNNVPLVVVGHGFVMGIDAYINVVDALTPNGYAVALVDTETGILPNHTDFGNDLSFTVDAVQALGGIFTGKFGPKAAVMGHSMGGGASFLIAESANVDCLVGFAPADTNPSAITAAANITKPTLIFAGEDDCIAGIANHQQPMYDALASSCKTLINVLGGSHCKFAENNLACSTGEVLCQGSLTRADQHAIVDDYLVPYYDFFLKGDTAAWATFNNLLATDTRISPQNNCNITAVETINNAIEVQIYPNPASDQMTVEVTDVRVQTIELLDYQGRIVRQQNNIGENSVIQLNLSNVSNGLYLLQLTTEEGLVTRKIVKQ